MTHPSPQPRRGVVLAAGLGTRLARAGAPSSLKPLTEVGGLPLVLRTLHSLDVAGCASIVIVLGHRADELRGEILGGYRGKAQVTFVTNERYELAANLFLEDEPTTWKGSLGWTMVIVGAIAGGLGVVAGVQANNYFKGTSDFEQLAEWEKIGYIVGGSAATVGVGLLIWEGIEDVKVHPEDAIDEEAASGFELRPVIGASRQGAMVGAHGRF